MKQIFGYACINLSIPDCKTGHTITRKSFGIKGVQAVNDLIIKNIQDLKIILKWNVDNGIFAYRLPDDFFPLKTFYRFEDLPDYKTIVQELKTIGDYCRNNNVRLSFHPGPFNVLASNKKDVVDKTVLELNATSRIFDLMSFNADNNTKINVHVGASYGDKTSAIDRFCENFNRLDKNVQKRLTVENDDKCNMFTVQDLFAIHEQIGIPIVFDSLHYKINSGKLTYKEAFLLSYNTWPKHIIPTVHHSSSKLLFENVVDKN
jgi:UV DNA damage endonuclease